MALFWGYTSFTSEPERREMLCPIELRFLAQQLCDLTGSGIVLCLRRQSFKALGDNAPVPEEIPVCRLLHQWLEELGQGHGKGMAGHGNGPLGCSFFRQGP